MVLAAKAVAAGVTAVSMVTLFSGLAVHFRPQSANNDIMSVVDATGGAVAGRIVSVPAKDYKLAFKATIKLGQCPLAMEGKTIKRCFDEFTGDEVFLAKGSMSVDVSRVQSSEDILTHGMGSVGTSVGVLGLISVSPKVSVAVTTETTRKTLNLISSYEMQKGVMTLHNPQPKTIVSTGGALYLSEIELGGNELLLVTLSFESEKQKVEVEVSVTFKILFISITAKLRFVHHNFKSKAAVRIQFKSTWREQIDETYSDLGHAIPRVEQIENMYMKGPQELRDMSNDDERSHSLYYFSSWKESPYGANFNLALINHDMDFLTEQNAEIRAVISRINKLKDQSWPSEVRQRMVQLNETLTQKTDKLTTGLDSYHSLDAGERQKLRDIYGSEKAPLYYRRELETIIAQ